MHTLTERDMAYDLLYGAKQCSHGYMAALLEAASPRCREVLHRLQDDCLRDQWRVWQFLHAKNEYRTDEATRQEIEDVRRRMEHLIRSREGQMGREEGGRWDGGRYAGAYANRWEAGRINGGRAAAEGGGEGARWGQRGEDERGRASSNASAWGYEEARRQPSTARY